MWLPGCSTFFVVMVGFTASYYLCNYRTYLYLAESQYFTFGDPPLMYVLCVRLYIDHCFQSVYFISSLRSSRLLLSKISILIIDLPPAAIPQNQKADNHRGALQ